jgi:hypothetical protein
MRTQGKQQHVKGSSHFLKDDPRSLGNSKNAWYFSAQKGNEKTGITNPQKSFAISAGWFGGYLVKVINSGPKK